ncbi:GNAT family N-acetyltransferase [Nonomuraea sp. NPDC050556]|uniref:GNAT family N-acetyltransferase n=1 Tax=Nonomuraea sp. NPDC050556 TaxID=3364369 RepID=UPI0037AAA29B
MTKVRRLTLDDLPACTALAKDRDWQPEDRKWRLLFDLGEVYGIDAEDGDGLAATNVVTFYGPERAVISMVLTASRYGRRGLGRQLMDHVLSRAQGAVVSLSATEYGRPLYEKHGFKTVGTMVTHKGFFTGRPSGTTRVADDLGAVIAYDTPRFGADRSKVLLSGYHQQIRVASDGDRITGFGGMWRAHDHLTIGPVVADDEDTARALIADLAAGAEEPVRLDLDQARPGLVAWAEANGVPYYFTTSTMVHGGELSGEPYLPTMQALG